MLYGFGPPGGDVWRGNFIDDGLLMSLGTEAELAHGELARSRRRLLKRGEEAHFGMGHAGLLRATRYCYP